MLRDLVDHFVDGDSQTVGQLGGGVGQVEGWHVDERSIMVTDVQRGKVGIVT